MTLELSELRLLAWQGPFPPCRTCGQTQNHRCRTSTGNLTTPHVPRMDVATGWDLRQPEVDALTTARDLLTADLRAMTVENTGLADENRTLTRNLEATTAERDADRQQIDALKAEVERISVDITKRDETILQLRARIAELEQPTPSPATRTYVGACPAKANAGFNLAALQGVVNRFGDGAAVRAFESRNTLTTAPRPADAGHVHASWPLAVSARPTAADLKAAWVNLKPGDGVERNHEADLKVRKGTYALSEISPALIDFAAQAKLARPDLLTTITATGWLFSPAASAPGLAARNAWGPTASHFDVVGVDLDGIHGWPYPKYAGHIGNILAFLDRYEIEWFAVPEVGWSRDNTNDPTGSKRMDDLATLVDALEATGRCRWIDAYVYESTAGNDFNTAETARWRNLVTNTQ